MESASIASMLIPPNAAATSGTVRCTILMRILMKYGIAVITQNDNAKSARGKFPAGIFLPT